MSLQSLRFLILKIQCYLGKKKCHIESYIAICSAIVKMTIFGGNSQSDLTLSLSAMSGENLFMPNVNNKGADQPVHARSLISSFVVHWLDSTIPLLAMAEISRPYLVPSAEQASLSLNWSQTLKTGFLVTWLKCVEWVNIWKFPGDIFCTSFGGKISLPNCVLCSVKLL